jgi:hypothetical protein
LYLEAGNDYIYAERLGAIDDLLNKLEKTAIKLTYVMSDLRNFNAFASKLEVEYNTQVKKISEILKEKETF